MGTCLFSAVLISYALFFFRTDDKGLQQSTVVSLNSLTLLVTSKIDMQDILAVEGVNEAAVKTDNAVRNPSPRRIHILVAEEASAFCSPYLPVEGRKEGEAKVCKAVDYLRESS